MNEGTYPNRYPISLATSQAKNWYIKYDSYVPVSFKHNLVHGLLNRAFKISSSFEIFKQEVGVIKNILLSNGYSYNHISLTDKMHQTTHLPKFQLSVLNLEKCLYSYRIVALIALN